MAEAHLSHDEFFGKLTDLFAARKGSDHGSIFLVQKRLSYGQDIPSASVSDPMPDLGSPHPLPVIIRATNGKSKKNRDKKIKLSTVVNPADLDVFYLRYADVCKGGMAALKPRDRSKKKAKAKKRKVGTAAAGNAS